MTLAFGDFSDNNALPLPLVGLDGVMLKLYPRSYAKGRDWLVAALAQCDAFRDRFPDFVIGFYAADSTTSWLAIKDAAANVTIDLRDHPFAFDWREWGQPWGDIASTRLGISQAHADGVHCGNYYRIFESLGQDWDWPSINAYRNGDVHTFRNPVLVQHDTTPFDQDSVAVDLKTFLKATVASYSGGDDVTPDEVAQAFGFSNAASAKVRLSYSKGLEDGLEGAKPLDGQPAAYLDGFDRGKRVVNGEIKPHAHAYSGTTQPA